METTYRITFDPTQIPGATHPLTSQYVDTFWLPILGPTTIVILRTLGRMYEPIANITTTPTTHVPLPELAAAVGIGGNLGRNSALVRTLNRLEAFSILTRTGPAAYTAATYLPDLRPAQVERLPPFLQAIHPQPANA